MRIAFILPTLLFFAVLSANAQPALDLKEFASGFTRPIDIAHCGDSRLFIVEQGGFIKLVDSTGKRLPDPFLDIDTRVNSGGDEQGLLGLAFHPNYKQNGFFFVNYIKSDGDTRVARFKVSAADPNKADPESELPIIDIDQPFSNHNGGCLKFGPDGYLYIAMGDGGSGGDPQNHGQRLNSLLGKMLRIDVNNSTVAKPYAIPPGNPFTTNTLARPEIWSLGWRNPWRFSFDRLTGDMWVGDVGQNAQEEISFEPKNTGGRNYGWRCYEGTLPHSTGNCLDAGNYTPPVFGYANPGMGRSVTGGFVYRGSRFPALQGLYFFADFFNGRWWATRRAADGSFSTSPLGNLADFEYSSFGEDRKGELYVAGLSSGKIFSIGTTSISQAAEPTNIRHFSATPNPAQDVLNVALELETAEKTTLTLSDALQRLFITETFQSQQISHTIQIAHLPAGIYFLRIRTERGEVVKEVVKN
jgi:glucose/arabinose dehydrogenase